MSSNLWKPFPTAKQAERKSLEDRMEYRRRRAAREKDSLGPLGFLPYPDWERLEDEIFITGPVDY